MTDKQAKDFYKKTKQSLKTLAKASHIAKLERYYNLTDYSNGSYLNSLSGKAQVFAQMAFHAQNAIRISNIVKFNYNFSFLNKVLLGFDPKRFLDKYPDENSVSKLVEDLRFDGKEGLNWSSDNNKSGKKDVIVTRYAKSLIACARYINRFSDRAAVLADLKNNYKNNDFKTLIQYFRTEIPNGFSIALTCDFLKEFDDSFCDLAKPDRHIKDVLNTLYRRKYSGNGSEYQCIEDMQSLTNTINSSLPKNQQITVYQLDRMIWLACTGNFYLDKIEYPKERYLSTIKG